MKGHTAEHSRSLGMEGKAQTSAGSWAGQGVGFPHPHPLIWLNEP